MPLPYFPLDSDTYDMSMNARPNPGPLIEIDPERYRLETAQKARFLGEDEGYYFQAPPETEAMAWEALEICLGALATHYPKYFELHINSNRWHWRNLALEVEESFTFGDSSTLSRPPLDWLARQLQEDVLLMDTDAVLRAGHLCCASSWSLGDKMGQSFLEIHAPTPQFVERIGQASLGAMQRLKTHWPTGRLNWSIASSNELNLAPRRNYELAPTKEGITAQNAGKRLFFRVERQVFTKMPRTGGILFTVHVYLTPLQEVIADAERLLRLAGQIKGIPRITREYKGWTPFYDALVEYLDNSLRASQKLARTTAHRVVPRTAIITNIHTSDNAWEAAPLPAYDVLAGEPRAEIHWLRRSTPGEPFYRAGLWRVQPGEFRYLFNGDHNLHLLSGQATLTLEDGSRYELKAGDLINVPLNTRGIWRIYQELMASFVITL